MTQQTAKQTKTTQQQYAVGDKVRILNVGQIGGALGKGFRNGDEAEVYEVNSSGFFIRRNDGLSIGLFNAESKYIEKVAEQMTKKFNVGDTVRVVAEHFHYNIGDTFVIAKIDEEGDLFNRGSICVNPRKVELVNAKPTQSTPKKKARLAVAERSISALEAQVAELTAKVEALEKAGKPTREIGVDFAYVPKLSANEQRKAIIAEAKAFVAKYSGIIRNDTTPLTVQVGDAKISLYVNEKKRTVTAIPYLVHVESHVSSRKKLAKCAPDDVFNADIGKAIALGRALGLDVKRFEQAVKPTEVVVGSVYVGIDEVPYKVKRFCDDEITSRRYGRPFRVEERLGWAGVEQATQILDDTDAQY